MTELHFKGKEFVYNHHLTVPHRPLVPDPGKGIGTPRLDGNLILQGDNLHALKALLPHYAGRVDCIFIDPPYNTGNEGWAYNDNVNAPMIKEWLDANPIGIEDGLRHDKWCAMMWPRLRLLHELLSAEGSIWLTIDDNEIASARALMDDVFGKDNFIACCVWQKRYSRENREAIGDVHDYVVVYANLPKGFKDRRNKIPMTEEQGRIYRNPNNDPRGPWRPIPMTAQAGHATDEQFYEIVAPGGRVHVPSAGRCWSLSKKTFESLLGEGKIYFGQDGNSQPNVIRYLSEVEGMVPWTWWPSHEAGHTDEAKKEILSIFGNEDAFDTPKPTRLISRILQIATQKNSIILDSFAGSGTTAHAVLEANRRDGGNRRFILVEMEDYADRLTAERVRRVINGYAFTGTQKTELLREPLTWSKLQKADRLTEQVDKIQTLHGHEYDRITRQVKDGALIVTGEKAVAERTAGLGGEFTYCTLGDPIDMDAILTGDSLPSFAELGAVLFHTATSQTFDAALMDQATGYLGAAAGQHLWLLYRADLAWLKTSQAALTLAFARQVAARDPDARHIVFAPANHTSVRLLDNARLKVEFAPLPYALYRVERS